MHLRHRTGRVLKWIGTIACVTFILTIVLTHRRGRGFRLDPYEIGVFGGGVSISWVTETYGINTVFEMPPFETGPIYQRSPNGNLVLLMSAPSRWWFRYSPESWGYGGALNIPLWPPLLLVAIPTARLWRRDRRYPPGHCRKCGYNLTGNETGVCSECGTTV